MGMGCFGGRGESGKPVAPIRGDSGMEFRALLGARGIGEFGGRSPGRGLMGRPGLIIEGAVTLRCNIADGPEIARWLRIAAGSPVGR
jgi:hypothetical protein